MKLLALRRRRCLGALWRWWWRLWWWRRCGLGEVLRGEWWRRCLHRRQGLLQLGFRRRRRGRWRRGGLLLFRFRLRGLRPGRLRGLSGPVRRRWAGLRRGRLGAWIGCQRTWWREAQPRGGIGRWTGGRRARRLGRLGGRCWRSGLRRCRGRGGSVDSELDDVLGNFGLVPGHLPQEGQCHQGMQQRRHRRRRRRHAVELRVEGANCVGHGDPFLRVDCGGR